MQVGEQAEALQWEAAERIHAGVQAGKSQRHIGREIGKDHKHVGRSSAIWNKWGPRSPADRPPFNDA